MMRVDFESQIFFFFQTVEVLSDVPASELALRLYLQCAQVYNCLVYDHLVSKLLDIANEL